METEVGAKALISILRSEEEIAALMLDDVTAKELEQIRSAAMRLAVMCSLKARKITQAGMPAQKPLDGPVKPSYS